MSLRAVIAAILKIPPHSLPEWGDHPWENWVPQVSDYLLKVGLHTVVSEGFCLHFDPAVVTYLKEDKIHFMLRPAYSKEETEPKAIQTMMFFVPVADHVRNVKILHDSFLLLKDEASPEELTAARARLTPILKPAPKATRQ